MVVLWRAATDVERDCETRLLCELRRCFGDVVICSPSEHGLGAASTCCLQSAVQDAVLRGWFLTADAKRQMIPLLSECCPSQQRLFQQHYEQRLCVCSHCKKQCTMT